MYNQTCEGVTFFSHNAVKCSLPEDVPFNAFPPAGFSMMFHDLRFSLQNNLAKSTVAWGFCGNETWKHSCSLLIENNSVNVLKTGNLTEEKGLIVTVSISGIPEDDSKLQLLNMERLCVVQNH